MKFLTKQEFQSLSEPEKSEYYESLMQLRVECVTAMQLDELSKEFFKLDYMDSLGISKELFDEAVALYAADAEYAKEKRKKGILISFIIVCAALLVASAVVIIGLF
jgi:hypothetical protein